MTSRQLRIAFYSVTAVCLAGCGSMIAGSPAWFEGEKSDVAELATADLGCEAKAIEYKAVTMDDYRHVQAAGCGKTAEYKLVKVGPISSWSKSE